MATPTVGEWLRPAGPRGLPKLAVNRVQRGSPPMPSYAVLADGLRKAVQGAAD